MRIVPEERALVKPGERFGRLTVIGVPFYAHKSQQFAVLQCSCGTVVAVRVANLRIKDGHATKSCGCLLSESRVVHGDHTTRLYGVWESMKGRCACETHTSFQQYGEVGIRVCDAWQDFATFREWAMATGFREGLSIDRRQGDRGYSPENCRWANRNQQSQNRRRKRTSKSPYKGGYQTKYGGWRASIWVDGKSLNLGVHATAGDAARAYDEAAKLYFGEFASLNFPAE